MFMTRVGAALVEIGGESYFFKQVRAQDSDEVGLYRAVAQLGLIVGPLIGSLVLLVAHIEIIFVVIGMIMFAGLPSTLKLFKVR
jgi:MFS family permease